MSFLTVILRVLIVSVGLEGVADGRREVKNVDLTNCTLQVIRISIEFGIALSLVANLVANAVVDEADFRGDFGTRGCDAGVEVSLSTSTM